jgi:hypothetical protein
MYARLAARVRRKLLTLLRTTEFPICETRTVHWLSMSSRGLPSTHFRRWGCAQGKDRRQWHAENIEAAMSGWSRQNLRGSDDRRALGSDGHHSS